MSKIDSNFGPRAAEMFKTAAKNGTYLQNADGAPNKDNIRMLKNDYPPLPGAPAKPPKRQASLPPTQDVVAVFSEARRPEKSSDLVGSFAAAWG